MQLKHEQPKAKLAEPAGANNKFDIGQKENRPFEALIRQRFAYQYNQRRSNQKLFCCPLFAMVLLLIIFALLDDLVKLEQEKEALGKKREEENCKACKSQANALCSFCSTKGTFVPGEDMCFDNLILESLSEKTSGMNGMRNCSINLPSCWEYVKYAIIVAILLLIRSILTQMMGVGKLPWETLLIHCLGKKIGMGPKWIV